MKTNVPVIIIAMVGVIGIGIFFFSQNSSSPNPVLEQNKAIGPSNQQTDDDAVAEAINSSRYVEYSKANFDAASSNRRVLFFYASWCPTCKPADASFMQNESRIPEDVTLIRVNYNDPETDQDEKDLAKKYGITYQHTFVQIDSSGNEVTKWNGGHIDELLSNIK